MATKNPKTTKLAPGASAASVKASKAIALHDAAQAVLNEIDRLALVCAGTEDLRQALRDYKGAQA
jgi:3-methyladenine DNA glycosylase/8-oxoguanine DNA glycosylase